MTHTTTPPPPMDDDDEDAATAGADAATADASTGKALVSAAIKRRKLYRQLTGTEVPWFPHDNDIELLKELCHEAGRPRWVYFGTPAGGAGMHGCIEMGCSVLALCYDAHHRDTLHPFLVQRAVEAMLGRDSMVFQDEALLARAKQLRLTKENTQQDKKGNQQEDQKEDDQEEKKEEKKEDKEKKKAPKKKRKKKQSSDSDWDSSSSTPEETPKKKQKKGNKGKA